MKVFNRKSEKGATIIEYVLIAALLAIAAIVALGALGNGVSDKFNEVNTAIGNA